MEKAQIGFIGCGGIAGAHLRGFKALYEKGYQAFKISACCDLVKKKAEDMAKQIEEFQGEKVAVYTNVESMLEQEKSLDGVGIFTPHDSHYELALRCIDFNKHIIIEKPLAITLRAGKKMIEAANEKGVILQVAENYRLSLSERVNNWIIKSGRIGTPRLLNWFDLGERKWYWQWRDHKDIAGGAWTLDGGVHFSDLWQLSLGDITKVSAVSKTFDPIKYINYKSREEFEESRKNLPKFRQTRSLKEVDLETLSEEVESDLEDTTSAILEFANGCIGTWVVSRATPGKNDRSAIVYGSEGALAWYEGIYDRKQNLITHEQLEKEYLKTLTESEKEKLFPLGLNDTFAIEDKQFIEAIINHSEVEVDGWTAYKAMAIPMAVYESASLAKPVQVEDILNLKIENYQSQLNNLLGIK